MKNTGLLIFVGFFIAGWISVKPLRWIKHRFLGLKRVDGKWRAQIPFAGAQFYDGGFWIRFFWIGLSVSDKEKHPPLYSERSGKWKVWRFGKWGVRFLSAS